MTNPNDPAQPQHGWSKDPKTLARMKNQGGLTKREYFAAMAMQGFVSGIHAFPDPKVLLHWKSEGMAIYWLKIADALIAELNKEPK